MPPMPTMESARVRLVIPGSSRLRSLLSSLISTDEVGWTMARVPGWCTLFVAATPAGVTRLDLLAAGTDVADALERLDLPAGLRARKEAGLRPVADEVALWLEKPDRGLELPLDIEGTAFQSEVWRALFDIEAGQTATYAEVARRIGRPRSVRAVGQAVGANPVSLAVPCHRVIAADGRSGGYAWGMPLKQQILAAERGACGA